LSANARSAAVVLAAGRGERLRSRTPKPLVVLDGKPLIWYSLAALGRHRAIHTIVVVGNAGNLSRIEHIIQRYRIPKVSALVVGGRRRQDSVRAGLRAVGAEADLILIHDAARPFIEQGILSAALQQAAHTGAAIVGVPVVSTIKELKTQKSKLKTNYLVSRTLDRKGLWEIQTPQVFRRELIVRAYRKFGRTEVTDDAMLVEKLGKPVSVVMGSYNNIKITTPEDLVLARAIAATLRTSDN